MFKNLASMSKLMEQAQSMQDNMAKFQESLPHIFFDGSAGGGAVKITINGKGLIEKVTIDASIINVDDKDVLEDLVRAASNDAQQKLADYTQDNMQKMTGNFPALTGFKLPF